MSTKLINPIIVNTKTFQVLPKKKASDAFVRQYFHRTPRITRRRTLLKDDHGLEQYNVGSPKYIPPNQLGLCLETAMKSIDQIPVDKEVNTWVFLQHFIERYRDVADVVELTDIFNITHMFAQWVQKDPAKSTEILRDLVGVDFVNEIMIDKEKLCFIPSKSLANFIFESSIVFKHFNAELIDILSLVTIEKITNVCKYLGIPEIFGNEELINGDINDYIGEVNLSIEDVQTAYDSVNLILHTYSELIHQEEVQGHNLLDDSESYILKVYENGFELSKLGIRLAMFLHKELNGDYEVNFICRFLQQFHIYQETCLIPLNQGILNDEMNEVKMNIQKIISTTLPSIYNVIFTHFKLNQYDLLDMLSNKEIIDLIINNKDRYPSVKICQLFIKSAEDFIKNINDINKGNTTLFHRRLVVPDTPAEDIKKDDDHTEVYDLTGKEKEDTFDITENDASKWSRFLPESQEMEKLRKSKKSARKSTDISLSNLDEDLPRKIQPSKSKERYFRKKESLSMRVNFNSNGSLYDYKIGKTNVEYIRTKMMLDGREIYYTTPLRKKTPKNKIRTAITQLNRSMSASDETVENLSKYLTILIKLQPLLGETSLLNQSHELIHKIRNTTYWDPIFYEVGYEVIDWCCSHGLL